MIHYGRNLFFFVFDSFLYIKRANSFQDKLLGDKYKKILENLDNNKKYSDGIPELELISQDCYLADKINSISKGTKIAKTVCAQNLKVDENSIIVGCLIGLDSEIGKNCEIKNCIIGDNVIIADNSKISDCILGDNYNFKTESKEEVSDEIFY